MVTVAGAPGLREASQRMWASLGLPLSPQWGVQREALALCKHGPPGMLSLAQTKPGIN